MQERHDITKCSCREDPVICQNLGHCSLPKRRLSCSCRILCLPDEFGARLFETCPSHKRLKGQHIGA